MAIQRASAATRETYGRTLLTMADDHPDIVVLGGDLNVSTFVHLWRDQYPERFFDFGPAEQNIVGVAAGLAAAGKVPFVSTFSVFGTGRPYDQLRVLVSQPSLNVKLVCTHAGILTGEDGMSAHGIEDLSLMCALPSFTVITPADAPETEQAVRSIASTQGPVYVRLPAGGHADRARQRLQVRNRRSGHAKDRRRCVHHSDGLAGSAGAGRCRQPGQPGDRCPRGQPAHLGSGRRVGYRRSRSGNRSDSDCRGTLRPWRPGQRGRRSAGPKLSRPGGDGCFARVHQLGPGQRTDGKERPHGWWR